MSGLKVREGKAILLCTVMSFIRLAAKVEVAKEAKLAC